MNTAEKEALYAPIFATIRTELANTDEKELIYKLVVDQLTKLPYFDWTGIYLLNTDSQELSLTYYIGKPTDHIVIPVGKGICGTAVSEHTDKIIDDVTLEDEYLACSLETRSEIVVLMEKDGKIHGQIDVDSDEPAAFDETDQVKLREIATMVMEKLSNI